jgi:hypothetical protein
MPTHETEIEFGCCYRDTATWFTGIATAVHFYPDGPERVTLSTLDKNGAVSEQTFPAPRCEPAARPTPGQNGGAQLLGFSNG